MIQSIEKLFQFLGGQINTASEKYIPYSKAGLSWSILNDVATTNPIVKKCLKLRQKNINANSWDIECKMFRSQSKNENIEWQIYQLLESIEIEKLISQYSLQLGIYGNSFLTFDDENKPIIQNPEFYKVYYDSLNQKARRYALIIDGAEQKGELGNLQNDLDLVHFKAVDSVVKPFADSPIDGCYDWILFYQHAVEANNKLASRAWVNILALLPENDQQTTEYLQKKDDKGKSGATTLGERLQGLFGGTKNSSKIAILDRIRDIKEVGKTNREMQFVETQDIIAQQIGHCFGFTLADLGKDVTYSNASTFNYQQYDLVGRQEEAQFSQKINSFLLPRLLQNKQFTTLYEAVLSGDIFFKFNPPKNPDKVTNTNLNLTVLEKMIGFSTSPQYKAKLINEFRDKEGLDPIDESLLIEAEPTNPDPQTVDVKATENFDSKRPPTPTQLALASKEFERGKGKDRKGYLPHFENKIEQQLIDYTETIKKKLNSDILKDFDEDFPKITKFYKRKDIKKDLLVFAKMGYQSFLDNTKKEKFSSLEDLKVPDYIIKAVEKRTGYLLGESEGYEGIDEATKDQIKTILINNISLSTQDLVNLILIQIPDITQNRAKIITESNVGDMVEGARYDSYSNEGYNWKVWFTVNDPNVRDTHRDNEKIGIIPIGKEFPNGNMRPGEDPFCRCTSVYAREKEEIQF